MDNIPDIPAFAVVVIRNDQPIFVQAYGMADKEAGIKADINTLFYIAFPPNLLQRSRLH